MPFQSTSPIPTLIKAVYDWGVDFYAEAEDVLVSIGYKTPNDATPRQIMVGVDDPASPSAASSGDGSQTMASAGIRDRDGNGSITLAVSVANGETDELNQWYAIQDAYELVADLETWVRANTDLGLTGQFRLLQCEVGSDRLYVNETDSGADALVVFALNYTARI